MPNIIKLTPSLCGCSPIQIGYRVENDARAIEFDFTEWSDEYGSGAVELLVKRKGDQAAYPVALEIDGTVATWVISDTDTSVPGYGKAEYTYTVGTTLAKTAVFTFFVAEDLADTTQEPPDPYQTWVDTLTSLGAETLGNAIRAEDAADRAEDAQARAETAEQTAEGHATAAAQSAGAARDMAASALSSADSASASATTATASATAASESATQAAASAQAAEASETAAYDSANTAAEEAEVARTAATTAQTAAQNASASAQSASNSATNAASSATSAETSATAAATSAEQAAESAEQANIDLLKLLPVDTASGSIASFPDGADGVPVEALTVSLEPMQDLHGQSSPYPAGGGKNKFDPSVYSAYVQSDGKYRGSAGSINVIRINIPSSLLNTPCTFSFYADLTNSGTLSTVLAQAVVGGTNKNGNRVDNGAVGRSTVTFTPTSTDDYVHITFGSNGANEFTFYNIQLEASSSVTDYAPYQNLCPITGHTAAQVWRAGVNLIDPTYYDTSSTNFVFAYRGVGFLFRAGVSYTLSVGRAVASIRIVGLDETTVIAQATAGSRSLTYTPSVDTRGVLRFWEQGLTLEGLNAQLEIGSAVSAYEPYNAVHISIPLGQTVYGASVDVVQGVCTVDRAMVTFDGSNDENWLKSGSALNAYYINMDTYGYPETSGVPVMKTNSQLICNMAQYTSSISTYYNNYGYCFSDYTVAVNIDPAVCGNTVTSFRAFLASNNLEFVYEMKNPITIDLSDIPQLTTLLGQNNIWSDSGDVDVTYRADIQRYIQKMIAEAIA